MDNTLRYERGNCGSIPYGGTNVVSSTNSASIFWYAGLKFLAVVQQADGLYSVPTNWSYKDCIACSTVTMLIQYLFRGVSSVVVAQLSVKQLDRVRFPLSPQLQIIDEA